MTRKLKEFVNQPSISASRPERQGNGHVAILLALHNGASMLSDQLESIAAQSHTDWSLIVSDDGSTDDWRGIAVDFSARHSAKAVMLMNGPRKGYAQNFLTMVQVAGPTVPFAAFCDQDDVWLPGKLSAALDALREVPIGIPALYCGRTNVTDKHLRPVGTSPEFLKPACFRNALVQSIAGGNTMVLNRAALDLLQDTRRHARDVVSHDWWAYQLVSGAGGRVIYDREPQVLYRQHGDNQIGSNAGLAASLRRLKMLCGGRFRSWNQANARALRRVRHWLSEDALHCLDEFDIARNGSVLKRLGAARRSGIYRQTRKGTAALWLAVLLRRL